MNRSESRINALRRERVILPSRRKHSLYALGTFCTMLAIPIFLTSLFGNASDARAFGTTKVEPIEEIVALAPLEDETLPITDILATETLAGDNPTENIAQKLEPKLDALGNPIGGDNAAASENENTLSGRAQNTQSKTILIDGKAITTSSLAPAPFAGLTQTNQYGLGPIKGPNGRTPLNSYNRPFNQDSRKQAVSIIISGLGVNRSVTQQAIDRLPPDVTLSFAAHTTGLQDWINRARKAGHEVMIEIPMDTAQFDENEPGADKALRANETIAKNSRNLEWLLSRGQGYFGVINYNGDTFLTRADVSAPMLEKIEQSGLGFITDGAFSAPSLKALSQSVGLAYENSFGLIDPQSDTQIIQAKLSNLAAVAKSGTQPIGVGFAYPETIDAVAQWVTNLDNQNLILAPASHTLIK